MNPSFIDSGIIINQIKFGEADKFIKIISQKHGLIETIAKGARRSTSRKSPHLDSLNLIKFQVGRSKNIGHLIQVEIINSFPNIKANLKLTRTCFYLLEILNQVIAPNQPDPSLFLSLKNYLTALDQNQITNQRQLTTKFQVYLIKHLGFKEPRNTSPKTLISYFESLTSRKIKSTKIKL